MGIEELKIMLTSFVFLRSPPFPFQTKQIKQEA